eukprot:COSAG02_NODE_29518_length_567_cov_5.690171_1_plen_77_part_00
MGEESDPSHPCPIPAAHSTPFDPAAVRLVCLFMTLCGSLCDFDCLQVKCEDTGGDTGRGARDQYHNAELYARWLAS